MWYILHGTGRMVKLPELGGSVLTFLRMVIAGGEVDGIVGTSPTVQVPSSKQ